MYNFIVTKYNLITKVTRNNYVLNMSLLFDLPHSIFTPLLQTEASLLVGILSRHLLKHVSLTVQEGVTIHVFVPDNRGLEK